MLDPDKLSANIENLLNTLLPEVFEQALLATQTSTTKKGSEQAKEFAKIITDLCAHEIADGIAMAIDTYIKNMELSINLMSTPCTCSPYSPGGPLSFSIKYMGNRTVTNSIGQSGMGPTGQGAITMK